MAPLPPPPSGYATAVGGEKRRGRLRIPGDDCIKRDLERVGGEWRTTAIDRGSWMLLIENVVREK